VRVGTSSGSLPQEEDVVTPPVAFGVTEHGPRRPSAGSIGFPDDAAPRDGALDGPAAEAGAPDAEAPRPVCA
jgi:hypothetical protein